MSASTGVVPLSLYIHFPWCVRKCPYCDFNSHGTAAGAALPEEAYVDALLRDLDYELLQPEPRRLESIFMGGGTPSLFSGSAIARVLDGVAARMALASDAEITLEANPGTADTGNFRAYRAAGVNRLSIGIQSFDDALLKRLGRIHGRAEALSAVESARAAGFENLNLDLMFALPQQTLGQAEADVRTAVSLAPTHLSYYQLTLEPNTEFARSPPKIPDEETAWDIQEAGQAILAASGYAQYEVSAYARQGAQCRHNRNYWSFGDYLGIGAGAHSKRTALATTSATGPLQVVRRARHKLPRTFLSGAGSAAAIQEQFPVTEQQLPFEYAMNALRLHDGFRLDDFERRTGLPASRLDAPLNSGRARGLIVTSGSEVRTTSLGRNHLNALLREFL